MFGDGGGAGRKDGGRYHLKMNVWFTHPPRAQQKANGDEQDGKAARQEKPEEVQGDLRSRPGCAV